MNHMTLVYIGLGANIENPKAQIDRAIRKMASSDDFAMVMSASYYQTSPVGYADQDDFVNTVIRADTALSPSDLYRFLRRIEKSAGRKRDPDNQNAARVIDCDILLYGSSKINNSKLIVPHPRMTERLFVMQPLVELNPNIELPGLGSGKLILEDLQKSSAGKQQKIVKL